MPESYISLIGIGVQTIIFLVGGWSLVIRNSEEVKLLKMEMRAIQEELKELSKVITQQAVQDQRLNEQSRRMTMLEQRVEDLRRGVGFIRDSAAKAVDREY